MRRMRLAQPRAFCGVLIKLRGSIVSFQDETYVQGLAEIWDWNFNGAFGPMAYQGRGSGKGCTVPSYRRVSNIPSPVSHLLLEPVRNSSAWTHAV